MLKRTTKISGEIWGNLNSLRKSNLHQTFGNDRTTENLVYYPNISKDKLILK